MARKKSNQSKPSEPVEVKEVKAVEVEAVEKVKPQFKNNKKDVKIKLIKGKTFEWITVKKGEVVSIPRNIALANDFEEVQ